MSLAAGTRIGPYEIVAPLGAGGMGEVYRARDARLGRDVAVKALPASDAADDDRLARFEREAQLLASLNHPHIAALYGIEDVERAPRPSRYLIIELLEGGTLADRLRGGAIGLRESVTVARQIADALQAAHDRGIIHRDLKPANIAFTADGHAKVLDFGLAKVHAASAADDTVAAGLTHSGVVVGTAAYMSPEQARGLTLDKRSDIWAFGCVLFEMLAGRHPFTAPSASDVVSRVLGDEPDWATLPADTPERVRWLLRRCLEKDTRRRLHDIADARIELDDVLAAWSHSATRPASAEADPTRPRSAAPQRERLAWAAVVVALLATVLVLTLRPAPTSNAGETLTYATSLVLPGHVRLSGLDPSRFALSPDGRRIVFVAAEGDGPPMLWLRQLDSQQAQAIPGTEGAANPFWAPDSSAIAFHARPFADFLGGFRGQLKRVDLARGNGVTSLTNVNFASTGAWSRNGVILFTPAGSGPLHRVSASGGQTEAVTTLDAAKGDAQHSYPHFLPDGEHYLFSVVGSQAAGVTDLRGVYLGSLRSGVPPRPLLEGASHARYASGFLLFLRDGTLLAQPFDPERLALAGEPMRLAERLLASGTGAGSSAAFSISDTGVLAYQNTWSAPAQLTWVDRTGQRLAVLGGQAEYGDVVLSPDGTRAAVSILDRQVGTRDIWIYDVARGVRERFTSHPDDEFAPVWPPAGSGLAFSATRQGSIDLYRQHRPGDAEEKLDKSAPGLGKFAAHWSPDGTRIVYIAGARTIARSDLMVLSLDGEQKPEVFKDSEFIETQARFSPDGRWIAYVANTTGRLEVYVGPFRGPGEPQLVSSDGGMWPLWRADGAELFFLDARERLIAAQVDGRGDRFQIGELRPLFAAPIRPIGRLDAYPYSVTPDGRRFLISSAVEGEGAPPPINLVVNWPALLRR